MILLDTNVVSAVMAPAPARPVVDWLNRQETVSLFLSTVTIAEIAYGIRILPEGRRRRSLQARFEEFVAAGFEERLLGFDEAAAHAYGEIMGRRKELGRPMAVLDGQIAAIARSNRLAVATGKLRDFDECGLELVDPFSAEV